MNPGETIAPCQDIMYPAVCILQAAILDSRWTNRLSQKNLEAEYATVTPLKEPRVSGLQGIMKHRARLDSLDHKEHFHSHRIRRS